MKKINPEHSINWYYNGEKLKYWIILDPVAKIFSISGDRNEPFCFNSLYEVVVPYDSIAIETESEFYGDQKILVLRKNYESCPDYKILMVMKWENGELSVWPNNYEAYKSGIEHWPHEN